MTGVNQDKQGRLLLQEQINWLFFATIPYVQGTNQEVINILDSHRRINNMLCHCHIYSKEEADTPNKDVNHCLTQWLCTFCREQQSRLIAGEWSGFQAS